MRRMHNKIGCGRPMNQKKSLKSPLQNVVLLSMRSSVRGTHLKYNALKWSIMLAESCWCRHHQIVNQVGSELIRISGFYCGEWCPFQHSATLFKFSCPFGHCTDGGSMDWCPLHSLTSGLMAASDTEGSICLTKYGVRVLLQCPLWQCTDLSRSELQSFADVAQTCPTGCTS